MFAFVEDLAKETDLLQTLNDPHPYFTPHLFYNNLTNNSSTNSDNRAVCGLHDNIINQKLTLNQCSESVLKRTTTEQFLFYDLRLTKEDFDCFKKVEISDFGVMFYGFNGQNLAEQVVNQGLIPAINNIILKLVNEILKISSVNVARILLVALNKDFEQFDRKN